MAVITPADAATKGLAGSISSGGETEGGGENRGVSRRSLRASSRSGRPTSEAARSSLATGPDPDPSTAVDRAPDPVEFSRSGPGPRAANRISVISEPALALRQPIVHPALRPPLPLPPTVSPQCAHGRNPMATAVPGDRNPVSATVNQSESGNQTITQDQRNVKCWRNWRRKYVLLCGLCGFSSLLLGIFYLTIYLVLRSFTTSLEYFQTMPTYIPAAALILTGLLVLTFMRRKHRNSILIKIVGLMCLVCAVLCVIVTVTTTVLHMNRLQTLRECTFYTQLHSCTCLPFTEEEPFELKLGSHILNCDVIHGPLYSCLRAMFGVSVIGILVSIFSCMLVYQLLSHEKKKMYWEQLENRRRFLYRRSVAPASCSSYNCCDEYGFASPTEIYPWRFWDSSDERYWQTNNNLYSPAGDESSTTSRSVLLAGNTPTGGTPSLLLPWGGAWRNYLAGSQRTDLPTPADSTSTAVDNENAQSDEARSQSNGVLLRPYIPRGLDSRLGFRRRPPTALSSQSRRPISDPGVAFQLSRYPPPFSETFLPPIPYEGLEAFSRLMWDPPPPYSQPNSQENVSSLANIPQSPVSIRDAHHALQVLSSPHRRTPHHGFQNLRGRNSAPNSSLSSPTEAHSQPLSPLHLALLRNSLKNMDGTGSLPLSNRIRCLPLTHVKSLDDINEATRDHLDNFLTEKTKEIIPLNQFSSQRDSSTKFCQSNVLPNTSVALNKSEQGSELYFADVSSCTSIRHGKRESEYFDPGCRKPLPADTVITSVDHHHYEQVKNDDDEYNDTNSNHNSDDTVIVHNSSSDHSIEMENDNVYSIISPPEQANHSHITSDSDGCNSYRQSDSSNTPQTPITSYSTNRNHLNSPKRKSQSYLSQINSTNLQQTEKLFADNIGTLVKHDHGYETISDGTHSETCLKQSPNHRPSEPSDFNGNVTNRPQEATHIKACASDISFATRRPVPLSHESTQEPVGYSKDPGPLRTSTDKNELQKMDPNSPERRMQSVQERLFSLKSVNV